MSDETSHPLAVSDLEPDHPRRIKSRLVVLKKLAKMAHRLSLERDIGRDCRAEALAFLVTFRRLEAQLAEKLKRAKEEQQP